MTDPFVSFVIPVFNSEQTLRLCLESILSVDYSLAKFEIIVVDNGSTDNSVFIAEHFPVQILSKPEGTISAVRNFGVLHAKGDIIAFVDSDCLIKRDWLKEALTVLCDASVGAVGSGYLTPENYTWVEKAWIYELNKEPFETDFLPGGNLIVKLPAFLKVGGFNESLTTGEDSDLCFRIKNSEHKVINSSRIKNVHLGNSKSIKQFIKKEFWYGKNMIDSLMLNPLDKVFYLSLILFASTICLIYGAVTFLLYNDYMIASGSILTIISITLVSSCYRVSKSKKYKYLLQINLLYFIYYLARSIAFLKSSYDRLRVVNWRGGYEIIGKQP